MSLDPDDLVPDGDSDDVGAGQASIGAIVRIAQAAYPDSNNTVPSTITTTDSSGNPIIYSFLTGQLDPAGPPVSSNQAIVAYISPDKSNIVIGIEGSTWKELITTDLATWGTGAPSSGLLSYLQEAAAFIQQIQQANPGASISLTGHSLGGAEAQILGYFMNLPATAINAPGVGGLVGNSEIMTLFSDGKLIPVGYNPATDDVVNVNVFAPGDPVHQFGTPFGTQGVLSSTDPNSLVTTAVDWWHPMTNHSVDTWAPVVDTIGAPGSTTTIVPYTPGAVQYVPGQSGNSVIVNMPIEPVPSTNSFNVDVSNFTVVPNTLFLQDPPAGFRYIVNLGADSPQVTSVLLPDGGVNLSGFIYWTEQGGAWSAATHMALGGIINLPAGIQAIRFEALDPSGHLALLPSDYSFYTTYAASGSATSHISSFAASTHDDFAGTGESGVLFGQANGTLAEWQLSGTSITGGGTIGAPGGTWTEVGAGDFNGDWTSDLLFKDNSGNLAIWEMNGTAIIGGGSIGNPGGTWAEKGIGDFNGDGKADVLFQDGSGNLAIWEMNGTAIVGGGAIGNPGGTWHVDAVGDFNGDGKSDVLFQDASGNLAVWEMNGTAIIGGGAIGNPGGTWAFKGVGDFNGDGKSDILFQDASGNLAIWDMNGTQIIGGGAIGNPGGTWSFAGIGDYAGDGHADILFKDANGNLAIWEMHDTVIAGGGAIGNPGAVWHVLS